MGFLYACDLFKSPVSLPFNGKEQLSTKFGFILSLGLSFLLLNSAINSDFFIHKKPTISSQSDSNESYGKMTFNRSNLTLVTSITDYAGVSNIDLSYFYFNMTFVFLNLTSQTMEKNNEFMKICEPGDFNAKDLPLNLSNKAFCVNQKELMMIGGSRNAGMDYGVIHLSRCDEYSSNHYNTKCKGREVIDAFFQKKFIQLYYTDNKFDLMNLGNPVNPVLNYHMTYIYPQIKKTTYFYLQKTVIHTEIGKLLIFSNFSYFSYFSL